jgi:hypothetical protein
MATTHLDPFTAARALAVLEDLIAAQRKRVLEYAQRLRPGFSDEDLRHVHDFPDVYGDPGFQFEEGQLAGYSAARIALGAQLRAGALVA